MTDKLAACAGKHRFESPGEAHKAAKFFGSVRHFRATAYRCPMCHGWHVGETFKKSKVKKLKTKLRDL